MNKVEGVPEGYELVRIGVPKASETVISMKGAPIVFDCESNVGGYAIIRKLPEPLQLREGAWYERRDGEVVGPAKATCASTHYPFEIFGSGVYTSSGRFLVGEVPHSRDLIREVPAPKPAVDPGEGWRLLDDKEQLEAGDQVYSWGTWCPIGITRCKLNGESYRRRIATHRPFRNAAEFEPHRDKWIRRKDKDAGRTWKPCYYANDCVTLSSNAEPTLYSKLLEMFEFSDGTPCGVKL